ncbi:MAG: STAS domain-containing protein [Desulfobacterales bacterium]
MGKKKKNQTKKNVRAGKDVVASKAESLNKKLHKIIEQGITELTLDFVNVKSIDPVGLSVIAATHNTMKNAGAKLLLKNVPDEINTLFDALGLNKHFEIEQMNYHT